MIVLSSLAVAAVGTVGFVASSFAVGDQWLPNLVPGLPQSDPQYADFIDFNAGDDLTDPTSAAALALDGKPMYRFSATINNTGGPLQAYMGTPGGTSLMSQTDANGVYHGTINQVIYDFGGPTSAPQADQMPAAGQNNVDANGIVPMVGPGGVAQTSNWQSDGHNHWHLQYMDAYRLLKDGVQVGQGNKAGFCLYDDHTPQPPLPLYYYPATGENSANDWCGHRLTSNGSGGVNDGTYATFVQWGLSPGDGSDLYPSNTAYQWIDTSGVQAGTYTVEATVNPYGTVEESSTSDNTTTSQRILPGPIAASESASTDPGKAVTVNVPAATIVGQDMRIRVGHECKQPGQRVAVTCLQTYGGPGGLGPGPLSYQVVQGPGHGTISGVPGTGPVTYTPAAGFTGTDTVVYKVTDTKFGFFSTGTITIAVGHPAAPAGGGDPSSPPSAQQQGEVSPPFATQFRRAVLRKGRDWRVTFVLNRRVDGTVTIQHRVGRRWARLLAPRPMHGTALTLGLTPRITWRTQYLRAYVKAGTTQVWSRSVRVPKHLPRRR